MSSDTTGGERGYYVPVVLRVTEVRTVMFDLGRRRARNRTARAFRRTNRH